MDDGYSPEGSALLKRPPTIRNPKSALRTSVVLVHGRGGSAEGMLSLAEAIGRPEVAYFAPQAEGHTWYPYSFLAPLAQNEPKLSAGLAAIEEALAEAEAAGVPAERTVLLGFSQGACLTLEYAARNARRFGGVVAFSGGLIGNGEQPDPPPDDKTFAYEGSLDGTPVFLGCSDVDPHIPLRRVRQTAEVMRGLGAAVTERIYPGFGHAVNDDEIAFVQDLLASLAHDQTP